MKGVIFNGDRIKLNDIGISLYLKEIKKAIRKNDFIIIPREKNNSFIMKYNLFKIDKIKKILLDLKEFDFRYEDDDKEFKKYGDEKVVVFIKKEKLRDLNYKECNVKIYIKIKMKKNNIPIISFHESEEKGVE